ncbi:MAG: hypothetical protein WKF75_15655 [Singulisphaera sp.]
MNGLIAAFRAAAGADPGVPSISSASVVLVFFGLSLLPQGQDGFADII